MIKKKKKKEEESDLEEKACHGVPRGVERPTGLPQEGAEGQISCVGVNRGQDRSCSVERRRSGLRGRKKRAVLLVVKLKDGVEASLWIRHRKVHSSTIEAASK